MSGEPTQRKLILYMSMSLDGFAARRDGTMDWLGEAQPYGDHRQRAVAELLGQTGLLVLGRRSAQDMAVPRPSRLAAQYSRTRPPDRDTPHRYMMWWDAR